MKTENDTSILKFSCIIFIAAIFSTGCAALHSYSGPSLPRDQVAILKLPIFSEQQLQVLSVDGNNCFYDSSGKKANVQPDSIELLPGQHTVEFLPRQGQVLGGSKTYGINVSAGETYKAFLDLSGGPIYYHWEIAIYQVIGKKYIPIVGN